MALIVYSKHKRLLLMIGPALLVCVVTIATGLLIISESNNNNYSNNNNTNENNKVDSQMAIQYFSNTIISFFNNNNNNSNNSDNGKKNKNDSGIGSMRHCFLYCSYAGYSLVVGPILEILSSALGPPWITKITGNAGEVLLMTGFLAAQYFLNKAESLASALP